MQRIVSTLALFTLGLTTVSHAESCGQVSIAEMNWPSAQLLAHIDKIILNHGYDCQANTVPGDTMPTFASMVEKNRPDIAPEMWENAYQAALNKAIDEGKLIRANAKVITGAGEGWYVTEAFTKAHPEIKTVLDVIEHPELFPNPEHPGKGAFHGCPAGWGCQIANVNLFKAFDMKAKGWKLVDPGSAAGLDGSISKASNQNANWLGYYWQPTSLVGKYNLKLLPWGIPFAGTDNWNCISNPNCSDPKPSAWIEASVATISLKSFLAEKPSIQDYLQSRSINSETMNAMLIYMEENQADGDTAAREFLVKYPHIWQTWVPEVVSKKIQASLNY